VVRRLIDFTWRHFADMRVEGLEQVPLDPVLYVSNHLSNADGITLVRALRPRRVWLLAGVKLQQSTMTRLAAESVDTISIRPGSADVEAVRRTVEALKAGRSVHIFPEGGRSRTGRLLRAKKGVALIAHRAKVPIVPVALIGTEKLMPINDTNMGGETLHHAQVNVRYGPPVTCEELDAEIAGAEDARQAFADALMDRVARLLPPEYQAEPASASVT
jgi:1-acyl-sn-glycerol-3-phosphate acyltransferase